MTSKEDFTIENGVTLFEVRDGSSISARFFDVQEAFGYCKAIKINASNVVPAKADIIWINGGARILGGDIRGEYIAPKSNRPQQNMTGQLDDDSAIGACT